MRGTKAVLVADSDKQFIVKVVELLETDGYRVVIGRDGVDTCRKVENEKFEVIITSLTLPKKSGSGFLKTIYEVSQNPKVKIIGLAVNDDRLLADIEPFNQVKTLMKPVDAEIAYFLAKSFLEPKNTKKETPPEKIDLAQGKLLMKEGDVGEKMFWLATGKLEAFITNENNEEVVIGEITAGELVGEMCFLDENVRSASVRALENSQLLVIPKEKFTGLLDSQPAWFQSLVRTLSSRLRVTSSKLAS